MYFIVHWTSIKMEYAQLTAQVLANILMHKHKAIHTKLDYAQKFTRSSHIHNLHESLRRLLKSLYYEMYTPLEHEAACLHAIDCFHSYSGLFNYWQYNKSLRRLQCPLQYTDCASFDLVLANLFVALLCVHNNWFMDDNGMCSVVFVRTTEKIRIRDKSDLFLVFVS